MFPLDDGRVDHSFIYIYFIYIIMHNIVVVVCCVHLFDGLEVVDIFCTHTREGKVEGREWGVCIIYGRIGDGTAYMS